MLNLLIAIISETFATFNSNYTLVGNLERASLIGENSYLIPQHIVNDLKRVNY